MKVPKKYQKHVTVTDRRGDIGELLNILAGHTGKVSNADAGLPLYNGLTAAAKRRLKNGRLS